MATRKTPLHPLLEKREAVFGSYGDWLFALRFGEVAHEYRAARSGSALADWGFHALTRVAGPDRRDFLQRLLTNDIPQQPGQGVHAFLLTSNGKPLIEAWVYQRPDDALLEVPRALHSRVVDQLERYHFREKLEIQDVSGQFAGLAVLGPRSRRTLEATGLSVPELAPYEHLSLDWRGTLLQVARTPRLGVEAYVLWVPEGRAGALWEALVAADPAPEPVGMEALEILRVEAGVPAYGVDYDEGTLFLEVAPLDSYSETKGCYIGQEVVARVLHRGHVNRRLVGLTIEGRQDDPAEPGAVLTREGQEVGRVTSTVVSPDLGPIALGYVRREHWHPGTELTLPDGRKARVSELPFR